MNIETRLKLLQTYRQELEQNNPNPAGEATGRVYLPIPDTLKEAGRHIQGVSGFINLFRQVLACSPIIIRYGELIVGNYYFSIPFDIDPLTPPVDLQALGARGAHPVPPSGHTTMDVSLGLARGWKGLLNDITGFRTHFTDGTPEAEYLEGEIEVIKLIQEHILAYSREAARLAEIASGILDAHGCSNHIEYQEISQRCLRLASEPPSTFQDALQWYFFYLTFARATSNGLGGVRLDQVFYPYYLRDRQISVLNDDQACLLLECLFMKEVPFSSIGGLTPDGKNAENELTSLVLDAYDTIGGTANLYLRWHTDINPDLVERAASILAKHHSGTPSIVNDEVIIPSLVHFGFPLIYARDYNFSGCFWWVVPGREFPSHEFASINGVTALDRALQEARTAQWTDFEELWQAYTRYEVDAISAIMDAYTVIDPWLAKHYPEMVLSLLMNGCLEKGRDANNNGVEFSLTTILYMGLATVTDSLTAIRKRVYTEKLVTLNEVLDAIDRDFVGYEWVQSLLKSAPKFGNDIPEADEMAVRVATQFKKALEDFHNSKSFGLRPGFYSHVRHVWAGEVTGATPDGRRAGVPLSQGGNPAHGCAKEGVTAAIRSITRIKFDDTAGCPIQIHLHGSNPQELAETITSIINTSMSLGAVHLIINVVDSALLWEAIAHPEQFAELTIRVTGYSAHFVQLDPRLQKEIAQRNSF
jgi:pyruvate-formate lyase